MNAVEREALAEVLRKVEVEGVRTGVWEQGKVFDAVERIIAARAAAPDALRERVEALADEWDQMSTDNPYSDLNLAADALRAALTERPTDGAGT